MSTHEKIANWLDNGRYADFPNSWDDKMFRTFILDRLTPETRLLDLGAGAGIVVEMNFRDHAARVCGVDPDPRVVDNPYLHEGREGFGESIPYEDESFDVVISDNVFEHLDNPAEVITEIRRVLKPGGRLVAKTPNFWHYVALGASITPHSFHRWFNAGRGRDAEDTFPTRYRANTRRDLTKLAKQTNMSLVSCEMIEGRPEYLRRWWPAYLLGTAYERIVNSVKLLEPFRCVLIAEFQKPAQSKTGTSPAESLLP
jgi:SAM-dependent methyltransferase